MSDNPFLSPRNIKIIYDAVIEAGKKKYKTNIGTQYYQQLNVIMKRIFSMSGKRPRELTKDNIKQMNKDATKELFKLVSYDYKNDYNNSTSQYAFLGDSRDERGRINEKAGLLGRPMEEKKDMRRIKDRELAEYVRDPSRENMPLRLSERSDFMSRGNSKRTGVESRFQELQNNYQSPLDGNATKVFDASKPLPDNKIKTDNKSLDRMFNKTHHSQIKDLENEFKEYEMQKTEDLYEKAMSRRNEMDKVLQETLNKKNVKPPEPEETRDTRPMSREELKEASLLKYKINKEKHRNPKNLRDFTQKEYEYDMFKKETNNETDLDIEEMFKDTLDKEIETTYKKNTSKEIKEVRNESDDKEKIRRELLDVENAYKKKLEEEMKRRDLDLEDLKKNPSDSNTVTSSSDIGYTRQDINKSEFEFSLNEFIDSDDDNYVENEKELLREHRKEFDLEQNNMRKEFEEYQRQLDEQAKAINERADEFKIILQEREAEIIIKEDNLTELESKIKEEQDIILQHQNILQEVQKELSISGNILKDKERQLNELENYLEEKEHSFNELEKEYQENSEKIKDEYEKLNNHKVKTYKEIEKYKKESYDLISQKLEELEKREKKFQKEQQEVKEKETLLQKREELLWEKALSKPSFSTTPPTSSPFISLNQQNSQNADKEIKTDIDIKKEKDPVLKIKEEIIKSDLSLNSYDSNNHSLLNNSICDRTYILNENKTVHEIRIKQFELKELINVFGTYSKFKVKKHKDKNFWINLKIKNKLYSKKELENEINNIFHENNIEGFKIEYDNILNKYFFCGSIDNKYDIDFSLFKDLGNLIGFENKKYVYGKNSFMKEKDTDNYYYEGDVYQLLDTKDIKLNIDGLVNIDNITFKSKRKSGKKMSKLNILLDINNKKIKSNKLIGYEYIIDLDLK